MDDIDRRREFTNFDDDFFDSHFVDTKSCNLPELREECRRCLDTLSPLARATLVRRFVEGYTYKEIGVEDGIGIETVRQRIIHSVRKIRRRVR